MSGRSKRLSERRLKWKLLRLKAAAALNPSRMDGQIEEKCQKSKKSFQEFPSDGCSGSLSRGAFHKPCPDRREESIFWPRVNKGILSADWPGSGEGIIYQLLFVVFLLACFLSV